MRLRDLAFSALLIGSFPVVALANNLQSNPIPGVGIVVKRNRPGSSTAFAAPGGFFGPGSEPFTGFVPMEGRCSHECGGCNTVCGTPDGRIDYAADAPSGPFDLSMASMTLYSVTPIPVDIGGATSLFDVVVTLSGPGPLADDPIPGSLALPPAGSLGLGGTSTVQSSAIDLHATITFADHATGVAAGGSLEQDLHLTLQEVALPIARVLDGTSTGHIVLGGDGASVRTFTFASSGDELRIGFLSNEQGAAVPVRARSWGAVKSMYR